MIADDFTCAQCGEVFEKAWSDADAEAEAADLFGDDLGDDPAVVCDDCFRAMTTAIPIHEWRASLHSPGDLMLYATLLSLREKESHERPRVC